MGTQDSNILNLNLEAMARFQQHIPPHMLQRLAQPCQTPGRSGNFELATSATGMPTLAFLDRDNNVGFVHNPDDPVGEAQTRAGGLAREKKDVYVFVGMGLGYITGLLLPLLPVDACVLIFEPSLDALALAMDALPINEIFEHPRVFLVPGEDLEPARGAVTDFLGDYTLDEAAFFVSPHVSLFGDFQNRVIDFLKQIHQRTRVIKTTRKLMQRRFQINAMHNMKYLLQQAPLEALSGLFASVPAVVVGPGVGLLKSLHGLAALREHCLIFCLNTAAPFLVEHGVLPHFIVAIDPQELVLKKAGTDIPPQCQWLIADFANHKLADAYSQSVYVFPSSARTVNALARAGLNYSAMDAGLTVATTALRLAAFMKASPIALCGMDFQCYDGNRYPWDLANLRHTEFIEARNAVGGFAETTEELIFYNQEFTKSAAETNARFVDIRETGLPVPLAGPMNWKTFLLGLPPVDTDALMREYRAAAADVHPGEAVAKKQFLRLCSYKHREMTAAAAKLDADCARLSRATGGIPDRTAMKRVFRDLDALQNEPLGQLLAGYSRRVPLSFLDCAFPSPPDKIRGATKTLSRQIEHLAALLKDTWDAFRHVPEQQRPALEEQPREQAAADTGGATPDFWNYLRRNPVTDGAAATWRDICMREARSGPDQNALDALARFYVLHAQSWPSDAARTGALTALSAADDGAVFVADELNHCVHRLSDSGRTLRSSGRRGSNPGEFYRPMGILAAGGRLIVADTWNNRIQILNPDGSVIRAIGRAGKAAGEFQEPWGLAPGPADTFFAADRDNSRIQHLDAAGRALGVFGKSGDGPGRMIFPTAIAAGPENTLFVLDATGRVQRFAQHGEFITEILPAGNRSHVCATDNGFVFVLEDYHRTLRCVTTQGETVWTLILNTNSPQQSLRAGGLTVSGNTIFAGATRVQLPEGFTSQNALENFYSVAQTMEASDELAESITAARIESGTLPAESGLPAHCPGLRPSFHMRRLIRQKVSGGDHDTAAHLATRLSQFNAADAKACDLFKDLAARTDTPAAHKDLYRSLAARTPEFRVEMGPFPLKNHIAYRFFFSSDNALMAMGHNRLFRYSASGNLEFAVDLEFDNRLPAGEKPYLFIAHPGPDGLVYIPGQDFGGILVMSEHGERVRELNPAHNGKTLNVYDLAFVNDTTMLVVDKYTDSLYLVSVRGEVIRAKPNPFDPHSESEKVRMVHTLPDGNLLITDNIRRAFHILSPQLELLQHVPYPVISDPLLVRANETIFKQVAITKNCSTNCPIGALVDIMFDSTGRIFAADGFFHRIHIFNSDLTLSHSLGEYGQAPGQFRRPTGIAFAPDGNLRVSDTNNGRFVSLYWK